MKKVKKNDKIPYNGYLLTEEEYQNYRELYKEVERLIKDFKKDK